MLYGGIELPALSMLDTYPYVVLSDEGDGSFTAFCSETPLYLKWNSDGDERLLYMEVPCAYYFYAPGQYDDNGMSWRKGPTDTNWGGTYLKYVTLVWANHDVVDTTNGTVYLLGTNAVSVGGSSSAVTDATFTIVSVQALDDSASVVYSIDGLGSTDAIYSVKGSLSSGGTEIRSSTSDVFSGSSAVFHNTLANLSPETEYTLTYTLLENDVETTVSASQTFTTLASATADDSVDETESLSLLAAIYAAIVNQNDVHLAMYDSIGNMLGHIWLRLRYIEENTGQLVALLTPSAEENALKEVTSETTQAVVDTVFAEDSTTKVTASDVGDMADSGKAVVNAFDTGTTVGDFFSVFTDYVFTGWFSEQTRANLDSVNSVSTFRVDDDPYNHDSYNKNMEALDKFLERSGK